MSIFFNQESKKALRTRGQIKLSLYTMAAALDKSGKTTAPITLQCSYVDLCKLGLTPYQSGSFLYHCHPVRAGVMTDLAGAS